MFIVKNGKSDYKIILSENCAKAEKKASAELIKYINLISGCTLFVSEKTGEKNIFIGSSAKKNFTEEIRNDGFAIKSDGINLYIFGGIPRGTLYGVYAFLEKLGCRFLDTETEYIPKTDSIETDDNINIKEEPCFEYRDLFWGNTFDNDFAAKLRLNGAVMSGDNGHKYSEAHGGGIKYAGTQFVHTFERLIPTEKYYDTHPEYFSLIDGERTRERFKWQPCLTNPDVYEIIKNGVFEWLREESDAEIISVSQNDSVMFDSGCQCPECRKINEEEGSPAGTLIRFINKLARDVEKEYPNVIIDTLAYQYSVTPPKITKPRHNVAIRMCTGGCYSHPLTECPENSNMKSCIKTWGEHCRRLYIWDYTTCFVQYLAPIPNFRIFRENAKFFRDNGVLGVFEQGNYQSKRNGEFCELRSYVLAHLLWNPECDDKCLINEFIDLYYGKGADYIHKYFDFLHEKTADKHFNWNPIISEFWSFLTDEDTAMLDNLFVSAKLACESEPMSLLHIKRTEISFRFLKAELHKGEFADEEMYSQNRKQLFSDCKALDITMYNEGIAIENAP